MELLLNFYSYCVSICLDETCSQDSDCDTSNCFYCLSTGKCGKFDTKYCNVETCGMGDGDCDPSDPCPSGLICGQDNFLEFHPLLASCSKASIAEVCVQEGK